MTVAEPTEGVPTAAPPADLLAAFEAYEAALVADDVAALDAAFAPGPGTLRGDSSGLLVGHEEIAAFRAARGGIPPRDIVRLETRMLTGDAALLVSVSVFRDGGRGLQTQLWQRLDGRWRITAAHVTGRAPALDRSIWRVVGDPLVPGAPDGPLVGLSVAVKDLFAITGQRVGAGNAAWLASRRPETTTAPAVEDLLRGGASVAGIARTDELAYSIAGANAHYGTPANGALPGGLPGGSSSGPASAVASGQADVGLATDTAGSIRVPASYQGLWGLRTTHGLVPRDGLVPLAQSFDTVGWLTRDGDTLERVVAWALRDQADDAAGPLPTRVRIPAELVDALEQPARTAFHEWLDTAAVHPQVGSVELVDCGDVAALAEAFRVVQAAEAWRNHGAWVGEHPGAFGPGVADRFEAAARITADQEAAARESLAEARLRVRALVADAVVVMPTVPGPAPSRTASPAEVQATRAATLRMTTLAGVGGLPALSAPFLTVRSGLGPAPVGVCLLGAPGTDLALVRRARALATTAEPGSSS